MPVVHVGKAYMTFDLKTIRKDEPHVDGELHFRWR
jgi:hypothetical protein